VSTIHLSVVIPVYNEIARIPATLPQMIQYLESREETHEVIVVDDGSRDGTAAWVEEFCRQNRSARLIRLPVNRGKGCAVRTGMMSAVGEYVLFTDADLSAPIAEASRLLNPLQNGYDVAIGSRGLNSEWIEIHQSRIRENAGKVFNLCLRAITGLPFRDTQCGFKAFRTQAARRIFALQTIDRFGFDAEILYLARKLGYRTVEVPVHWAHSEGTKVRMWRDGVRMATDLLKIRWNDLRGRYSEASQRPPAV
jgi:glycosyltransferase involved in cell wall biosynthesis